MENNWITTIQTIILFIAGVFATMLNYIGLDKEVYGLYCCLLVADYITGMGRAYALKIEITSMQMRIGMISKMSLFIVPIMLSIAFKMIHSDGSRAVEIGMIILGLSEFYSFLSNVHAIKTGKDLPEWDALASLARYIKSIIMQYETGEKK